MTTPLPLNDVEMALLMVGISEFNNGRYWQAHEEWEDLWKRLKVDFPEPQYKALQGLIQCAALLYQYQKENPRGVSNMWSKLCEKMGRPGNLKFTYLWGIDVGHLLAKIESYFIAANNADWNLNCNLVQIHLSEELKVDGI
ncbi:MAG TPA: DUF309 domain-containing protein [Candidatus Poseidoniales archaeon]|jgi:hypothetical protein|nr:MAG: hypothetical protein CXT68_04405 [Euryarchaeota archaeon]HIF16955.1 DUF309 domain-containing protein [Candidatus Poseidoniales archaeon]